MNRSQVTSSISCITLRNIPLEAYDYIVNGKSALDWVVERQWKKCGTVEKMWDGREKFTC